ncbi:MAG: hypothetical protein ACR2PF_03760 [Rhizobiaceae bacterium]
MQLADIHQLSQYRGMGETDAPLHPQEEAGVLRDDFGRVGAMEMTKEELAQAEASGDVEKIKHWQLVLHYQEEHESWYQADVAAGWYNDNE